MSNKGTRCTLAAGLIERVDHALLIALPSAEKNGQRRWIFPRGPVEPGESPEAAMRRLAKDHLGIEIEVVVGQPPVVAIVVGKEVELRYMFCGVITGEPQPGPYAEVRWTPKQQLMEYDFDSASKPVVAWLLGA